MPTFSEQFTRKRAEPKLLENHERKLLPAGKPHMQLAIFLFLGSGVLVLATIFLWYLR